MTREEYWHVYWRLEREYKNAFSKGDTKKYLKLLRELSNHTNKYSTVR